MTDASPRRRRFKRLLIIAGVTLVLGYFALLTIGCFSQGRLMFPRHFAGPARVDAASVGGIEEVWLTADDGERIVAWFMPGDGRTPDSPGPAVVFAHGNGELIDDNIGIANMYARWGVSSIMVEYRGYGRAPGTPGQREIVGDFVAFHDWLIARPEVDPALIAFHGRSLGGGVASALAAHRKPAAMVLESTFTSAVAMAERYLFAPMLLRHPFRSDAVLPTLGVPVLIMHGTSDYIIPVEHGRTLNRIIPGSRFVPFDSGHNDLAASDRALYEREIHDHLVRAGLIPPPPATAD